MKKIDLGKFSFNRRAYNLSMEGHILIIERAGGTTPVLQFQNRDLKNFPKYLSACVIEARVRAARAQVAGPSLRR